MSHSTKLGLSTRRNFNGGGKIRALGEDTPPSGVVCGTRRESTNSRATISSAAPAPFPLAPRRTSRACRIRHVVGSSRCSQTVGVGHRHTDTACSLSGLAFVFCAPKSRLFRPSRQSRVAGVAQATTCERRFGEPSAVGACPTPEAPSRAVGVAQSRDRACVSSAVIPGLLLSGP